MSTSESLSRIEAERAVAAALREGRPLDFARRDPGAWARAIDRLGCEGELAVAAHGARLLQETFPRFAFAQNLCEMYDRMPVADGQLPFAEAGDKEVQIVPHSASDAVLLLFCGRSHRLGLPLPVMHRWLGLLPASLIYLRDFRLLFYLKGLPSLGADRAATLAALREIVASLNGRRLFCCGSSVGTYAALHYGLDLGAEAVIGFAGTIKLDLQFNQQTPMEQTIARLHQELPNGAIDLREAYAGAERAPRVHIVCGDGAWDDRMQAETLAGLPTVTFDCLNDCATHNVTMELIRRGQYLPLLESFLAPATDGGRCRD